MYFKLEYAEVKRLDSDLQQTGRLASILHLPTCERVWMKSDVCGRFS